MLCVQARKNPLEAGIVDACCEILANLNNTEVRHVSASASTIALLATAFLQLQRAIMQACIHCHDNLSRHKVQCITNCVL